ncbi:chemotaxis protein CheX [Thermodesulforhabdus norvegica]|uniref:Chemotaxis phosphatase CheX n=1 Tax=Thermodesulforhabdus norvegica TaxID=39841 RepID=A0A1I4REE7_9BACT|nr:chemotaxis protein CheX [Thermodesulforhabdus norvegica]SFM50416.1 Chemotaxis phosphatase CheX [Thermodesulforhabdus norvegica]
MEWQELMRDVISETLEKMFFTIVEFEGEEENQPDQQLTTHINLKSEENKEVITIVISLNLSFARQLTADFLGKIADDITETDTEDCMKELANMTGGGMVAKLGGSYKLELPQPGEPSTEGGNAQEEIPLFVLGSPVGKVRLYKETSS